MRGSTVANDYEGWPFKLAKARLLADADKYIAAAKAHDIDLEYKDFDVVDGGCGSTSKVGHVAG